MKHCARTATQRQLDMLQLARWMVGLFLCLGAPSAMAQVNIETMRQNQKDKRLSTSAQVDLTNRSGNVDITELEVDLRNEFRARTHSTLLFLQSDFGWQNGQRFSNEALGHLRYVHLSRVRVKPEAFVQFNYDKSRLLDRRMLAGAGVRWELLQRDKVTLSWGTAYMLEHEKYDLVPGSEHEHVPRAHRWSNYFSMFVAFNENIGGTWTAYAQPQFDDFEDMRVLSEASVGAKISEMLWLSTTFKLQYDARPPDSIEDLDTRLSTGINVQF